MESTYPAARPQARLQHRGAQPYAAIGARVTMNGLTKAVDEAFPELYGWLSEHALAPAGPPFIRYLVVDTDAELQIEMGVPVAAAPSASGRIRPGVLPAGRYVVLRHTGPYDGLAASNAALQEWAREHGITLDSQDTDDGTAWGSRVEHYLTEPSAEPDPARWQVDVTYLTC